MATKDTADIKDRLEQIKEEKDTLRAFVAEVALDRGPEETVPFFNDLLRNGCISGMVNSLICYTDTHAFFDRHYAEIEELRIECQEACGEPLRIDGDLKNTLAWFAFEETARTMADELGL